MIPQSAKDSIIKMRIVGNMQYREIADKIGVPVSIVSGTLREAGLARGTRPKQDVGEITPLTEPSINEQSLDFPKTISNSSESQEINMGSEGFSAGGNSPLDMAGTENQDLENLRSAVAITGIEIAALAGKGFLGFGMNDKEKEVIISAMKPIIRRHLKSTNQQEAVEILLLLSAVGSVLLIHKDEIAYKFEKNKANKTKAPPPKIEEQPKQEEIKELPVVVDTGARVYPAEQTATKIE